MRRHMKTSGTEFCNPGRNLRIRQEPSVGEQEEHLRSTIKRPSKKSLENKTTYNQGLPWNYTKKQYWINARTKPRQYDNDQEYL